MRFMLSIFQGIIQLFPSLKYPESTFFCLNPQKLLKVAWFHVIYIVTESGRTYFCRGFIHGDHISSTYSLWWGHQRTEGALGTVKWYWSCGSIIISCLKHRGWTFWNVVTVLSQQNKVEQNWFVPPLLTTALSLLTSVCLSWTMCFGPADQLWTNQMAPRRRPANQQPSLSLVRHNPPPPAVSLFWRLCGQHGGKFER